MESITFLGDKMKGQPRPIKIRRHWNINPKTKIVKNDKLYDKNRERIVLQQKLKEDSHEES